MPQFEHMFTTSFAMPNGLQGSDDGLWIVDQESDDIFLVDRAGTALRRLRTETENGSGITFGEGALWVGSNGPSPFRKRRPTDRRGSYVLKIDPDSGETLAECSLEGRGGVAGGVHGVEWVDGTLWVTRPSGKVIQQLDTKDFSVVHQIPSPAAVSHGLAWVDGELWCLYRGDRVLLKQDTGDGRVLERIEIPEPNPTPHGLTFWEGHFVYCDAAHGDIRPDGGADFVTYDRGQVWRIIL